MSLCSKSMPRVYGPSVRSRSQAELGDHFIVSLLTWTPHLPVFVLLCHQASIWCHDSFYVHLSALRFYRAWLLQLWVLQGAALSASAPCRAPCAQCWVPIKHHFSSSGRLQGVWLSLAPRFCRGQFLQLHEAWSGHQSAASHGISSNDFIAGPET